MYFVVTLHIRHAHFPREEGRYLTREDINIPMNSITQITFLHKASIVGSLELANEFLRRGGDPNAQTKHGNTTLHICCKLMSKNRRYVELFHLLALNGGDLLLKNYEGKTCLDLVPSRALQREIANWILVSLSFLFFPDNFLSFFTGRRKVK